MEKVPLCNLHTIELEKKNSKDLENMECKQGRFQIIERSQIKCLVIYSQDMLINTKEKIFIPSKHHRDTQLGKCCQVSRSAIDSISDTVVASRRQVSRFQTNGFQAGIVKKKLASVGTRSPAGVSGLLSLKWLVLKLGLVC